MTTSNNLEDSDIEILDMLSELMQGQVFIGYTVKALQSYITNKERLSRIDELENLYLGDVHFGCDKNDEEFVVGSDPKDLCCYCYPHKSCLAYKGYEALEKIVKDRVELLKQEDNGGSDE